MVIFRFLCNLSTGDIILITSLFAEVALKETISHFLLCLAMQKINSFLAYTLLLIRLVKLTILGIIHWNKVKYYYIDNGFPLDDNFVFGDNFFSWLIFFFPAEGEKKLLSREKNYSPTNEVTHPTETPLYLWYDVFMPPSSF